MQNTAFKLVVRDNIPADKFMRQMFSSTETEKVEAGGKVEEPRSSSFIMKWTSPSITPCDMSRLGMYQIQEKQGQVHDKAKEEN